MTKTKNVKVSTIRVLVSLKKAVRTCVSKVVDCKLYNLHQIETLDDRRD